MELAFEQAEEALGAGEVPVGCALVLCGDEGDDGGRPLATGRNEVNATKNATRHAELVAVDRAHSTCGGPIDWPKVTCFVTVEPCIMCAQALKLLGVGAIVYGCGNARFGGLGSVIDVRMLPEPGEPWQVSVVNGVQSDRAVALLQRFYRQQNPNTAGADGGDEWHARRDDEHDDDAGDPADAGGGSQRAAGAQQHLLPSSAGGPPTEGTGEQERRHPDGGEGDESATSTFDELQDAKERLIWKLVVDSGHITAPDANNMVLVCKVMRDSVAGSPPMGRLRVQHKAMGIVFNSGCLGQKDGNKCMRVCRPWSDAVNAAANMWRHIRIDCVKVTAAGVQSRWSDGTAAAVGAKRPKAITIRGCHERLVQHFCYCDRGSHCRCPPPPELCFTGRQLAGLLACNPQLERLTLDDVAVEAVRALGTLKADSPLASLAVPRCYGLDAATFATIVHGAPVLKLLGELHGVAITHGDGVAHFIGHTFTGLKSLSVAGGDTLEAVRQLCAESAHTRTSLRELHLLKCALPLRDTSLVADDILEFTSLESVRLVYHWPYLGEDGWPSEDAWRFDLQDRYRERQGRDVLVNDVVAPPLDLAAAGCDCM